MRKRIGLKLLEWALWFLPLFSYQATAVRRALGEFREYERYRAYCDLMGETPICFLIWRRDWQGVTRWKDRRYPPDRFDVVRGRERQEPASAIDLYGDAA
jgi:hypothetical protein